MAEERTSIFKGMSAEISGMKKTEKKKKKEISKWDNYRRYNIHILRVPERKD